jgi:hypothetical protein
MRMAALASLVLLLSTQGSAVFSQTPPSPPSTTATAAAPRVATSQPSASPIQTQFKAFKVIFLSGGKEELEPASSVSPGDVVEYVAVHRNVSGKRLLNTDFAIPIPHGMSLWQGGVQPTSGKLIANTKESGTEKSASSQERARVVWRVDQLNPGQSIEVKLRVSIDPDPSLPPAKAVNPFAPRKPDLRRPER